MIIGKTDVTETAVLQKRSSRNESLRSQFIFPLSSAESLNVALSLAAAQNQM